MSNKNLDMPILKAKCPRECVLRLWRLLCIFWWMISPSPMTPGIMVTNVLNNRYIFTNIMITILRANNVIFGVIIDYFYYTSTARDIIDNNPSVAMVTAMYSLLSWRSWMEYSFRQEGLMSLKSPYICIVRALLHRFKRRFKESHNQHSCRVLYTLVIYS